MKKTTPIIQQWTKSLMNNPFKQLSVVMLAMSIVPTSFAANLKDMSVVSLPGERVELKLIFDEPVLSPKGYTIDQPARIALDLPGVSSQLNTKKRPINIGNVRELTVVEANDTTRLVVSLNTLIPYTTRSEGNNVYITLGDKSSTAAVARNTTTTPTTTKTTTSSVAPRSTAAIGKSIRHVDFRRGDNGEGSVVIKLSDNGISPDVVTQGNKVVLNFPNTEVPEALRTRLDVKDFATPVQFINVAGKGNGGSISIESKGNFDYLVFQANNELTVSVKHVTAEDKERQLKNKGIYKGDTLSLNFQDIEVRSVLQILADFTKLNLVATDSVGGNITLRLQNVPWDQALDIIMRTKGLAKRQEGNILIVAPADELAQTERTLFDAKRTIEASQPLRRELITINYASALDIVKLFQESTAQSTNSISTGSGTYQANLTMGDNRGSLTVDERTNTIIANQTEVRLEELRGIVAELDRPVRQVQIEARIVEANVDFAKNLGVRWGANLGLGTDSWKGYGGGDGRTKMDGQDIMGTNIGYDDAKGFAPPGAAPLVDLGAFDATSGFGVGFFSNHVMLDLKLNAMQKSGQGEIISQPKVTTTDKKEARILKGTEIAYREASSSGAATASFKDAVLLLKVTPQITPDNQIMMEVTVTKDSADFARQSSGVPAIDKNEVNAEVIVSDGETMVIGGVFQNTQSKTVEKVPFLGDLPVLGRLFRRDTVNNRKSELLIFITPRILDNKAFASRS